MAGSQTAVPAGERSPRLLARTAGVFYLLNIITGSLALAFYGRKLAVYGNAAILISTACYIAVTLLFFKIFKPVDSKLSLLAAFFSMVGCGVGALRPFHLIPAGVNLQRWHEQASGSGASEREWSKLCSLLDDLGESTLVS